jgi:hypothetical protein
MLCYGKAHVAAVERGTGWGKRFLLIGASAHFSEAMPY